MLAPIEIALRSCDRPATKSRDVKQILEFRPLPWDATACSERSCTKIVCAKLRAALGDICCSRETAVLQVAVSRWLHSHRRRAALTRDDKRIRFSADLQGRRPIARSALLRAAA
jgi:hypothetical protein